MLEARLIFVIPVLIYILNQPIVIANEGIVAPETNKIDENSSIEGKTHCAKLNEKYKENRNNLTAFVLAKKYSIIVMSTSRAPSQAAATLMAMALKHKLGYQDVFTRINESTNCELASNLKTKVERDKEFFIHVDADWHGPNENCTSLPPCNLDVHLCSIAGTRLSVAGATPGVNIHMFAMLGHDYSSRDICMAFNFVSNVEECGLKKSGEESSKDCFPVLVPFDVKIPTELKTKHLHNTNICLNFQKVSRLKLAQSVAINNIKASFFFIDYDLYEEDKRVVKLPMPTQKESETTSLRVAEHAFRQFAPLINDLLRNMTPKAEDLREIIDINSTVNDIEESTCKWIEINANKFDHWTETGNIKNWILILNCKNNSDFSKQTFHPLLGTINTYLNETIKDFSFSMRYLAINCSDANELGVRLTELPQKGERQWLAGVAGLGAGAEAGVKATRDDTLVLYDVPPTRANLHNAAMTSTGNLQTLVQATILFLHKHGWHRVAIVSDKTPLAEDFNAALLQDNKTAFKPFKLDGEDDLSIGKILSQLQEKNARIIILNVEAKLAQIILCKVADMNIDLETEYAWIVRDWQRERICKKFKKVFSISFSWHGGNYDLIKNYGGSEAIYSKLNSTFGSQTWPPFAVSLFDAVLVIANRLAVTLRKHPELRFDFHNHKTTRKMTELLKKESIAGVIQPLDLYNHSRKDPMVFVTSWTGNVTQLLAIWQANSSTGEILEVKPIAEAYMGPPPHDGSLYCGIKTGDSFSPRCDDALWAFIGIICVLAPIALWIAKRTQHKYLKRKERDTLMRLLARSERRASILRPYLVDRSALELHEVLGTGHFGRVRFGLLRQENRRVIPVAAKALVKDASPAEEAEFLREASTLAKLSHPNVIRLVGVSADRGPPLLLMDHAFFGDLLSYLRVRRHLAEREDDLGDISFDGSLHNSAHTLPSNAEDESYYVSPPELTRLVRQAAEALAYLNECHLIHRDVRAANCLVDDHRMLKLGDFGMAREVGFKTRVEQEEVEKDIESDYKYICRRKGIFPVPWMAPESLERGEFTHASDVWALGVLILEVATLGARPYGAWRPYRIFRYVQAGGRPALPVDASYHTCEVLEMCWAPQAGSRASAAAVGAYLRAHAGAVRAALRAVSVSGSTGSDSGLGDADWGLRVSTL